MQTLASVLYHKSETIKKNILHMTFARNSRGGDLIELSFCRHLFVMRRSCGGVVLGELKQGTQPSQDDHMKTNNPITDSTHAQLALPCTCQVWLPAQQNHPWDTVIYPIACFPWWPLEALWTWRLFLIQCHAVPAAQDPVLVTPEMLL